MWKKFFILPFLTLPLISCSNNNIVKEWNIQGCTIDVTPPHDEYWNDIGGYIELESMSIDAHFIHSYIPCFKDDSKWYDGSDWKIINNNGIDLTDLNIWFCVVNPDGGFYNTDFFPCETGKPGIFHASYDADSHFPTLYNHLTCNIYLSTSQEDFEVSNSTFLSSLTIYTHISD